MVQFDPRDPSGESDRARPLSPLGIQGRKAALCAYTLEHSGPNLPQCESDRARSLSPLGILARKAPAYIYTLELFRNSPGSLCRDLMQLRQMSYSAQLLNPSGTRGVSQCVARRNGGISSGLVGCRSAWLGTIAEFRRDSWGVEVRGSAQLPGGRRSRNVKVVWQTTFTFAGQGALPWDPGGAAPGGGAVPRGLPCPASVKGGSQRPFTSMGEAAPPGTHGAHL